MVGNMRDWERWLRENLDLPEMTDTRDERVVSELAAHLEDVWREARDGGATEAEADARVRARLGKRQRVVAELVRTERHHRAAAAARWAVAREEDLRQRGHRWIPLADLAQDVRLALRALLKQPLFTAVVVLVLALGIGATAAIFSIVHAVVLEPLPYPDADRLVGVWLTDRNDARGTHAQIAYVHYRRENRVLEELGIYDREGVNLGGAGDPERVNAALVTPSIFRVLDVGPEIGRPFVEDEGRPGAEPTVVLSHALWAGRYGADPGIIGRALQVDGVTRTVVGVMPASFEFPESSIRLWLPLTIDPVSPDRSYWSNTAVGRLKPGVSRAEADAQINELVDSLPREYPDPERVREVFQNLRLGLRVTPYKEDVTGEVASTLWLLLASVGVLFLVACANVANLFLVRAEQRRQEVAVRVALGASRTALVRTFLAESATLALAGGAAGLALARIVTPAILAVAPEGIPRVEHVGVDATVVWFVLGIAMVASLVLGLAPGLRRVACPAATLQAWHRSTDDGARARARSALAVAQMTLTLVLMAASGLMVRSVVNLHAVEHGFDPSDVLTLRLPVSATDYAAPQDVAAFYEEVLERIRALPGVATAGAGDGLPYERRGTLLGTSLEGFPIPVGEHVPNYPTELVFPGYFESLDIPLRAGRFFRHADLVEPTRAVIVSQALADRFWPGENPIGRRLTPDRPESGNGWYEIVGVVGSVRYEGLAEPPTEVVYYPFKPLRFTADAEPIFPLDLTIVVEASVPPASLVPLVTSVVWDVNPGLPVVAIRPMAEVVARALARPTFSVLLVAIAAVMTLLIGIVGLYGVMSSFVSQRTREMGIRLALGATAGDVTSMVLKSGMLLAGMGIVGGIAAALALTRFVRSFLFEVSPSDPFTLAGVAVMLAAVAAVASYLPAHRAARVDPILVLRAE